MPGVDETGAAKLLVVSRALRARRDHPEWFDGYEPVAAGGPAAGHLVAFDRGGAVTVATRLPAGLAAVGGWGDTTLKLPTGAWRDLLTGTRVVSDATGVRVADLLRAAPGRAPAPDLNPGGALSRWGPRRPASG